jgi:plastocyanin
MPAALRSAAAPVLVIAAAVAAGGLVHRTAAHDAPGLPGPRVEAAHTHAPGGRLNPTAPRDAMPGPATAGTPGPAPSTDATHGQVPGAIAAPAATRPTNTRPVGSTGTIEGTVTLPDRPQRRTVNRYAGSGNAAARTLQAVPNVVYLEGAVSGPARAAAGRHEVAQQDTAFAPAVLVVPVGTTVSFPNRDAFFHNVFSFSPTRRFDLGRYGRGESKDVVFDRPGVSKIYCEVHQYMRAAVVVVESPHYAVVGDDGRFVLRDVPAGTHRLVVWDIERRPQELEVTVTAGGTARVSVALQ